MWDGGDGEAMGPRLLDGVWDAVFPDGSKAEGAWAICHPHIVYQLSSTAKLTEVAWKGASVTLCLAHGDSRYHIHFRRISKEAPISGSQLLLPAGKVSTCQLVPCRDDRKVEEALKRLTHLVERETAQNLPRDRDEAQPPPVFSSPPPETARLHAEIAQLREERDRLAALLQCTPSPTPPTPPRGRHSPEHSFAVGDAVLRQPQYRDGDDGGQVGVVTDVRRLESGWVRVRWPAATTWCMVGAGGVKELIPVPARASSPQPHRPPTPPSPPHHGNVVTVREEWDRLVASGWEEYRKGTTLSLTVSSSSSSSSSSSPPPRARTPSRVKHPPTAPPPPMYVKVPRPADESSSSTSSSSHK
eukprot:Sspe_Gene.79128::Locus_49566_Transcript_1_1_Confidence_1.000_Length_1119::g.79128::m.79128